MAFLHSIGPMPSARLKDRFNRFDDCCGVVPASYRQGRMSPGASTTLEHATERLAFPSGTP
jgi:hypothetical protein